jgi:hypothetical protein
MSNISRGYLGFRLTFITQTFGSSVVVGPTRELGLPSNPIGGRCGRLSPHRTFAPHYDKNFVCYSVKPRRTEAGSRISRDRKPEQTGDVWLAMLLGPFAQTCRCKLFDINVEIESLGCDADPYRRQLCGCAGIRRSYRTYIVLSSYIHVLHDTTDRPQHHRSVHSSEYLTESTVRAFATITLSLCFDSFNSLLELEPSIGLTLR